MQIQSHDTADVDQQLVIAGWQEHYQQMSAGCFHGAVVHMELNGIEAYEERMNTRIEQHFHAPADSLVFSFDTRNGSLYLLNEDTQNTWITPENYQEVGVVIGPRYLSQLDNLSHMDGLFLTQLVSQQSQVFGRWLSRTLQQLATQHSPLIEESLAQQLVDDCLYILDCPSQAPDRTSQKHLAHDRRLIQRVFDLVMASPPGTPGCIAPGQGGRRFRSPVAAQLHFFRRGFAEPVAALAAVEFRPPGFAALHPRRYPGGGNRHALVILAPGAFLPDLPQPVWRTAQPDLAAPSLTPPEFL